VEGVPGSLVGWRFQMPSGGSGEQQFARSSTRRGSGGILLVLDDLTGQDQLLRVASHLADRLSVPLLVEHVVERDPRGACPSYTPTDPETAGRLVDRVLDHLRIEGVRAEGEVTVALSGYKGEAIVSAAAESSTDLIVMEGTRLSPLFALAGLSPVHRVLRTGRFPVLVVPAGHRRRPTFWLRSWIHAAWRELCGR
jgi:nucleotide-binding universal stress UspA family protein